MAVVLEAMLDEASRLFALLSEPTRLRVVSAPAREALGLAEPVRSRWLRGPVLLGLAGLALLAVGLAALLLVRGAGAPAPSTLESAPPDSLVLLDPESGTILGAAELGSRPGDVPATEDAVWVVSPDDERVFQIDPDTRSVVDAIPVDFDPAAVALGLDAIWVAQAGGPSLARISAEEGEIVQTYPIGVGPSDVAVGRGAVWVTNRLDDSPLPERMVRYERLELRDERCVASQCEVGLDPKLVRGEAELLQAHDRRLRKASRRRGRREPGRARGREPV